MIDFTAFLLKEEGATAIEYGLIAALISITIILALTGAGEQLRTLFETVEDELTTAVGGGA